MLQAGYLKMLRVLRDFTKEYREAQKERIHRLNSNLDKLVNGTPPVVNAQLRRNKSSQVSYSNRVRKHAMMLYSILREKLQAPTCPCKVCALPVYPTKRAPFSYLQSWANSFHSIIQRCPTVPICNSKHAFPEPKRTAVKITTPYHSTLSSL